MNSNLRRLWTSSRGRKYFFSLIAVVMSLIVAFFIIEFGLRLLAVFIVQAPNETVDFEQEPDLRVLCAGDSHTEGVGASPGYDYPSQLQAMLRRAYPQNQIAVINIGRAGYNSTQAAESVAGFRQSCKCRTQIVIFNAGKNNDHNFAHAHFLPDEMAEMTLSEHIKYLLANSRTFRLGQVTVDRLRRLSQQPDVFRLHWNQALDVEGQEEQKLLRDWVERDIAQLRAQLPPDESQLVLLNYWQRVPFLDLAFRAAAQEDGVYFIDVNYFAMPLGKMGKTKSLVAPDLHPNRYGYAFIARHVMQELIAMKVLPPPD